MMPMNGEMYQRFLRDSFMEHMPEVVKESGFAKEDTEFDEASREGVYKENYYLRDHLQIPYVSKTLAKKRVQDAIVEFTGRFKDDHVKQLSTSGPVYTFTFGAKEAGFLYDTFGVTADQLVALHADVVKETYFGKISSFFTGWVKNAPYKILLDAILIEAVQKGYEDIITCCEYLWAFCVYPIVYREYWKIGVKEDLMNYTIEHLGNKYKIKEMRNLEELLKYDATKAVAAFMDELKIGADNTYYDLMHRMHTQINSKIKNIAREYYNNDKKNATMHNNVTQFDDGEIADQEGHTTNVAQVVDKTVAKFATAEINNSFITIASDRNQVDKGNLSGYIAQIYATKQNKLPRFIENIITIYFSRNPTNTSIGSSEFLNYGIALYRSIGTSKDPLLREIKEILNKWMYEIIDIRSQYQREATIINYTRAIFDYMIFMIMHYN